MDTFNRRLLPIYLILLVDVLGFTILFPLLPFYAEHFGASPIAVGSLGTVYALCQLVAGPLLGMWSDRLGRRPVLLISQAGTFLSFLLLALAPTLRWLYLARALDGATAGNVSVAHAYLADVTKPEERGRAFALMSTVFGIGFIAGPSLSAALFHFGYQVPILAAAATSAVSIVLTLWLLPKNPPQTTRRELVYPWVQLTWLLRNPLINRRLLQFALFAFSFSLYFFGLPLFAERRFVFSGHPFGPGEMGGVFLTSGCVSLLVQSVFMRRWFALYGEEAVVNFGCGLAAAGYALLALSHTIPTLLFSVVVIALANSILRPGLTALISRHAHPSEQGATMGALQSAYSLSDLVAPLLAGWMIGHGWLSLWAVLMALAIFAGASLVLEVRGRQIWHALF